MTKEDLEELAAQCGMIRGQGDIIKPLWTASDEQLARLVESVIQQVKQSASEIMVRAIKKAVEYERAECAKIADIAGMTGQDISRAIREREND